MLVRQQELPGNAAGAKAGQALNSMPTWPVEAIRAAVTSALPAFTVEVLPELDSSNSELMRRARAGQLEPVLLLVEAQTAGRGRLGRQWHSGRAVGEVLTFSLGLPLRMADWSGLSLAVGVSVAQSLHPELRLKWPNDLWWNDRKLGGILIETALMGDARYAVIGIGINILPREAAGLSTPPAWLTELLPGLAAHQALQMVVPALVRDVLRFEAAGWAPFAKDFAARDALAGREITLSDGTVGRAAGVDPRGALMVHTSSGLRSVDSAEVSVRPRV